MGLTEGQFFQSSPLSFRVQKIYEQHLECNPTAIYSKEFPIQGSESNWIHIVGKEGADLAKNLLDSNAASSDRIREKLNKIS